MSTVNANFCDGVFTITDDAAHSQTLNLSEGDLTITYDAQGGRQVTVSETRGAVTGVRRAARQIATISMTAKLADPGAPFQTLAMGQTAGYVSTVADLGDARGLDWSFSFPFGAALRSFYGQDLIFGEITITEGDPSTISFSGQIIGPVYSTDSTNGIKTLVASR